jgi:hypothetical protein
MVYAKATLKEDNLMDEVVVRSLPLMGCELLTDEEHTAICDAVRYFFANSLGKMTIDKTRYNLLSQHRVVSIRLGYMAESRSTRRLTLDINTLKEDEKCVIRLMVVSEEVHVKPRGHVRHVSVPDAIAIVDALLDTIKTIPGLVSPDA